MKGPDKSGHQTIVEIVPDHNQKNGNAFHNINITNPCCLLIRAMNLASFVMM